MGVLCFTFETFECHDFRFEDFIVRRALARKILTLFKLSFVGYLQNFDNACFLCLITSLQSSLNHGLLFFGFVEVFRIHRFEISIRVDGKLAIGSEEIAKDSIVKDWSRREWKSSSLLCSIFISDYDLQKRYMY